MSMQQAGYAVGVDIGGMSMVVAVLSCHTGEVINRAAIPTEPERGPDDGFQRLGDLIARVCAEIDIPPAKLAGVGVGCTGPIDPVAGRVNNPYTLPTWEDAPLLDYLTGRFNLPAVLLNDAQAAALGEYWVGAGRGVRHLVYITVGTGVGGGLIINGQLHRGVGQLAGEVGHQVIDMHGPQCYCGARGCLEMLAAAPAISRRAAERAKSGDLLLQLAEGNRDKITPKLVYAAAKQGDHTAAAILHDVGGYLGIGVANLLNILSPEMVVLGGGVMQGWDLIAPEMLQTVQGRRAMVPYDQIRIVQAQLGMNAGVSGAVFALLT